MASWKRHTLVCILCTHHYVTSPFALQDLGDEQREIGSTCARCSWTPIDGKVGSDVVEMGRNEEVYRVLGNGNEGKIKWGQNLKQSLEMFGWGTICVEDL